MARGTLAKENVISILKSAFGNDYVGEYDKKVYVWADDGGDRVQICISMTCPKMPIGDIPAPSGDGYNFEEMDTNITSTTFKPAEITEEETKNIEELMKALGL